MKDIEETLTEDWRKLSERIDQKHDGTPSHGISAGNLKRKTALQRLAARYRQFAILETCGLPLAVPMFLDTSVFKSPGRIYAGIIFVLVMSFAAAYDWWLYRKISLISVTEMPVIEILRKAWLYRKRHLQFIAFFLPVDMLYIGLLFAISDHNISFLCGMITGAVIGLVIGIKNLRRFMADYRKIFEDND